MSACCGSEPIDDDEVLFRRFPEDWSEPGGAIHPSHLAFSPSSRDVTGLSLSRAKYVTPEDAGRGPRADKKYYVAVLRAGDLRQKGIKVIPSPSKRNRGHCEIPILNYATRCDDHSKQMEVLLAGESCLQVLGPF